MRGRAWRRHIEERVVISRLKYNMLGLSNWWYFEDVNKSYYRKALIVDFLEKSEYFSYKTHTTKRYDSKSKVKYSPNKNKNYWRDEGKNGQTRESDRRIFLKILKENGLK
jgi:hypothetical protein